MPVKSRQRAPFNVPGFRASGISCGIKKRGGKDIALVVSAAPARVSGLFTTNSVKAAPVLLDMKRVRKGVSRGVIVNSGCANACTGRRGARDSARTASLVEKELGLKGGEILVASTGVIGVPLPMERIEKGVPRLVKELSEDGLKDASRAIMTTDAFPKTSMASARIGGKKVTVGGIAKGAGMICPDMATMLAFLFTDANISRYSLSRALKEAAGRTFNSISVDNDTSTNDTVLLFANGLSGCSEIRPGTPGLSSFTSLLERVSGELAHMIVRDGEGATRFIEILVKGARSDEEARSAARTIAGSMLVKTAFFGGDPNWGRILAALGRSGVGFKEGKVDISFNGVPVVRGGLDTGNEKKAARAIKKKEVLVSIDLKAGKGTARFWTSDLSYEYVRINSAYRT